MAYDEQRSFTRPALHTVVHADIDGRRMYSRDHSVGFHYMNQTPYVNVASGLSSPLTRSYAPSGPTPFTGPSRRPLPTPRTRPESMPPPPRQPPLVVQAPAPSRPAILAPSATLPTSPTVPPARRPLPTPVLAAAKPITKHSSIDLTAKPASPVRSTRSHVSDRDLHLPDSFTRRAPPLSDPAQLSPTAPSSVPPSAWPRSSHSDSHETQPSKAAPPWNRSLPAPSSVPIGANAIERRSTVSGVTPPAIVPPRSDARRAESSERAQPALRPQSSPPRRPLPSSPTEPPRVPSLHQRVPASSEDEHDLSSPSDISSISDRDSYEPMTFADPMQVEDDDEPEIVFAKSVRTSSPSYGIRDLPARTRIAIANRDDGQNNNAPDSGTRPLPMRSATLPQPPTSTLSSPPRQALAAGPPPSPQVRVSPSASSSFTQFTDHNPHSGASTPEPQSLTLRFASMGLTEERARERERKSLQETSSCTPAQSPVRTPSVPSSPVRQQAWPTNVPPLPRTPGNTSRPFFGTTNVSLVQGQPVKPSGISSPVSLPTSPTHPARPFASSPISNATFDRKSFAQQSPRPPPHFQSQQVSQQSERQLQKQRVTNADIDLDDAPPPSLRRSPSPIPHNFTRAPAEITNDSPPRRQWTPGQDVTSRSGGVSGDGMINSHAGFRVASQSPERIGKSVTYPPVQSPTHPKQKAIPRVSLPDGHRNDVNDDDDTFGPRIFVPGPGGGPSASSSARGPPSISISEAPSISVSEHGVPAISVSAADSPSIVVPSPKISIRDPAQTQRGPSPFGSRHTTIQEPSRSHPAPGRCPGPKRGLPPPPSSNPVRTNGLSCGGCNGPIIGRIVSAMGQRWHPNCFRCSTCNELLEHVSSYERDGRPYCHLDYHETFAPRCFHCKTAIIDERFITLDDPALGKRTYHEQHFFCAECGDPFLAPTGPLPPSIARTGELNLAGDGEFVDDDVGFTVYKGHPYCEACHVRLRMPKCQACKKPIRDGVQAVEALGGKWCWGCFVCEGCKKPFEDPSFFLRNEKPFCEPCFSLILRNDM